MIENTEVVLACAAAFSIVEINKVLYQHADNHTRLLLSDMMEEYGFDREKTILRDLRIHATGTYHSPNKFSIDADTQFHKSLLNDLVNDETQREFLAICLEYNRQNRRASIQRYLKELHPMARLEAQQIRTIYDLHGIDMDYEIHQFLDDEICVVWYDVDNDGGWLVSTCNLVTDIRAVRKRYKLDPKPVASMSVT